MNKTAVISTLVGICGGLAGFGVSQMTIANEVRAHSVEIQQIQKDEEAHKVQTDQRIFEVVGLVRKVMESSDRQQETVREFIQLLKVQNELLQRRYP